MKPEQESWKSTVDFFPREIRMRRGFRRGMGRGGKGRGVEQARELLDQGHFSAAASAFEELAVAAEARSGPGAPMLYIQAGRAQVLAGQPTAGLDYLKKGLQLLAERGRWVRFQRLSRRITAELRQAGLNSEADDLAHFTELALPKGIHFAAAPAFGHRPSLPTHCPSCGAAIKPDEADWIGENTVECDYCGSPINAQNQS
jgi:hypothetical protein